MTVTKQLKEAQARIAELEEQQAETGAKLATAEAALEEAKKTAVEPPPVPVEAKADPAVADDARTLFKTLVSECGQERAAEYFGAGLTLEEARAENAKAMKAELEEKDKQIADMKKSAATGDQPDDFQGTDSSAGSTSGAGDPSDAELSKFGLQSEEYYENFVKATGGDAEKLMATARKEAIKRFKKAKRG